MHRSDVFVLIEPTRGVDVGAKLEIYRRLEEVAADGAGVLVISTDVPEVVGISDRIAVLYEGRITRDPRGRRRDGAAGAVGDPGPCVGSGRTDGSGVAVTAGSRPFDLRSAPSRTRLAENLRWLGESLGVLAIAGALLLAFSLTSSVFLLSGNIRNIFVQISVVGVAAIGETIVMLSGGIDLSVGSVVLLSEVISADLTTTYHWPVAASLCVALLASGGIGLVNGILVSVVGIEPILVTLGSLLSPPDSPSRSSACATCRSRPRVRRPRDEERALQSSDHGRRDARPLRRGRSRDAEDAVRPQSLFRRRQPPRGKTLGAAGCRRADRRLCPRRRCCMALRAS